MKAKKSYGQHFLTSEVISERIANSLSLTETYNDVLEVGPGQGMLTKYLLEKDYNLDIQLSFTNSNSSTLHLYKSDSKNAMV